VTLVILVLLCILLMPLAAAGLALIQQGLGRSRSAAHAMLAALCTLSVTAIIFVMIGSAFAAYSGAQAHIVSIRGVSWDWLGSQPFFARKFAASLATSPFNGLALLLEMFAVGIAAIIPLSTGTDRWRLAAICAFSALFAAILFPLFAHWVWGFGWLTQLSPNFGLPAFIDNGGASVIQVMGGLAALSVAWILGPRQGKYTGGVATAIPGHNIVQVLFGCLLSLVGFIALDSAASILFRGADPLTVILIAVNATLAAASGCLAALLTTRLRYRKPDASLTANGWIAGLVAGSASCAVLSPARTVFVGFVAGVLVAFLVELLELKLYIDDPAGAISVHLGAGLWGLLAAGLLAPAQAGSRGALLLTQLIAIATLLGIMFPLIHLGNLLLNRFIRYRVDADGDWQGMDIRELGAGAYPEFVMHADEFVPR
jgi:Amt family ammonium transporter